MARLTNATAAASVAALLVVASARLAEGCSCTGDASILKGLQYADAMVFQGVVQSVEPAEPSWRHGPRRLWCWLKESVGGEASAYCVPPETEGYIATLTVQRVWKGKVEGTARVHSFAPGDGSCGVTWRPGDQWLIAGFPIQAKLLTTSICSSGLSIPSEVERLDAAVKAR